MDAEQKVDILLVDDHPSNLLALEAMLADLGENIVKASSGFDALRCLLDQEFAVILLDVQMPDMDGFETAALIRNRERSRHTPIIFLTAYNRNDSQVFQGYSLGAVDFLFKPIIPAILRSKVAVFVELFKKTEEVKRQAQLLREAERREHEQGLLEAKQRWEADRLREEMENERRIARELTQKSQELARTVTERERAEQALRRSNERLQLLSETASRLLLEGHPQEFMSSLFDRLSGHLGLEVHLNYLLEPQGGGGAYLSCSEGIPVEIAEDRACLELGRVLCDTARDTQRLVIDDLQDSDVSGFTLLRDLGLRAFASYALLARERLIGVLAFGTARRAGFDPDEIALLQAVCDQVAVALERDRLIAELQQRADALAEADRRKDEYLAMLAHELRNPLAPVLHALHVMRMHDSGNPIMRRAQDAMERQTRHMVRLVDDLLDVSRITRGKIELRRERVALPSLIEQAAQTCRPFIQEREQELQISLPEASIELEVDPTRLCQVLANLLNNAAKYSPPGSRIHLVSEVDGDMLEIRVEDDGSGIAPEVLPRIFELFVQADRTLDRSQGGLGIGLTMVRKLVELHGGTVTAHSEGEGQGSQFRVRLPLDRAWVEPPKPALEAFREAEVEEETASDESHLSCGRPLEILVVEDNKDIRDTLKDLLELWGHRVEMAEDGASGVQKVLAGHPQVALVDIGLPGMDGYRVAREIRSKPDNSSTRLVALTGYGRPQDRSRAFEAGFDAYLVKPVSLDELSRLLAEL